jgi:hypothetical protein
MNSVLSLSLLIIFSVACACSGVGCAVFRARASDNSLHSQYINSLSPLSFTSPLSSPLSCLIHFFSLLNRRACKGVSDKKLR